MQRVDRDSRRRGGHLKAATLIIAGLNDKDLLGIGGAFTQDKAQNDKKMHLFQIFAPKLWGGSSGGAGDGDSSDTGALESSCRFFSCFTIQFYRCPSRQAINLRFSSDDGLLKFYILHASNFVPDVMEDLPTQAPVPGPPSSPCLILDALADEKAPAENGDCPQNASSLNVENLPESKLEIKEEQCLESMDKLGGGLEAEDGVLVKRTNGQEKTASVRLQRLKVPGSVGTVAAHLVAVVTSKGPDQHYEVAHWLDCKGQRVSCSSNFPDKKSATSARSRSNAKKSAQIK